MVHLHSLSLSPDELWHPASRANGYVQRLEGYHARLWVQRRYSAMRRIQTQAKKDCSLLNLSISKRSTGLFQAETDAELSPEPLSAR